MKQTTKFEKILCCAFLAVFLLAGCSGLGSQPSPTPEAAQSAEKQPIVSATGKVMPAEWSQLSLSTSGTIQEILVRKGARVQKGDVLLRLKGKEDLQAAIANAEFNLATAQKNLDDLKKNASDTRTAAVQKIADATKALRDAQYQLDNFTVPQTQASLSTKAALQQMGKQLDAARAAFEPYKYAPSTDATRKDLKEKLDDAQADYNSAVKRLQYETEYEVAKANLADAVRDYDAWKDGPDPEEQAVAEASVANAKAALDAAHANLNDLELIAPFAGIIGDMNVRAGEWVTPGQPAILMADLDHLQIETTDLNEIDAARVKVGDPVKITFDAFPGMEVNGAVKGIAPKSSEGSGVNYTAVITMDEITDALRWGMTAFVDILVQ